MTARQSVATTSSSGSNCCAWGKWKYVHRCAPAYLCMSTNEENSKFSGRRAIHWAGWVWKNGGGTHLLWFVTVLLRYGAVNWIYVTEYKVHFHIVAALVRSKHNGVGCLVIELQHNARMIIVRQTINIHRYILAYIDFECLSCQNLPW